MSWTFPWSAGRRGAAGGIPLLALTLVLGATLPPARAHAALTEAALANVGVHTPAGAREPLDLAFRDQTGRPMTLAEALGGRPALLIFQDYRCRTLCGPALGIVAARIKDSGLRPGRDFRLVAIGLNPRETPADAASMQDGRLRGSPALMAGSVFLTGDAQTIASATRAVGYGYAYDAAADQFTHPVAAFALAADGRVMSVLPEVALTGPDMRRAIQGADRGQVGDLVDRLSLLCHGLIPLTGLYDKPVEAGLQIGGLVTVIAIGAGLAALAMRRRRRAA